MRRLLTLVLFALAAAPAAAQPPEAPQPATEFGDEVEVAEVLLDVLVTDRDGNVIVGLGPDDFVVTEDGERRDVTGVTFYSNRVPEESVPAAIADRIEFKPNDRFFILLFEDQRTKDASTSVSLTRRQLEAARRAKEWVARALSPNDWVAVASFDTSLKLQTDFTRDRELLDAAIDAAARAADLKGSWPSRAAAAEEGAPSLAAGLPAGRRLMRSTSRIYSALATLAGAAGEIRGRKNLVFFSTGFGEVNTLGQYDPEERYYEPMVQALNDNNVAVYSIDLAPLGVNNLLADSLSGLSAQTGGRFFDTFTSFETPLGQVVEETSGYYLLSYRSPHRRGEDGFQEVEVAVANPDFRVRTREGYLYGQYGG